MLGLSRVLLRFLLFQLVATPLHVVAADVDECERLFKHGDYDACIAMASEAVQRHSYGERWRVLKVRAELQTGRYAQAAATVDAALSRYTWSIQLRVLAQDVYARAGRPDDAARMLQETAELAEDSPWRYADADDLIALGTAALRRHADPRHVLEQYFDRALQESPESSAPYLASAELALRKHDDALAAAILRDALKRIPDDPDLHFALARALASTNPEQERTHLSRTLELNPRHAEALAWQAEQAVDREDFAGARALIDRVLAIHPHHERAWSLRAVVAHLQGDSAAQASARKAAIGQRVAAPEVDHLIGQKLSQKYRFREGAACQRRALEQDPQFTAARMQLAQDLLRLGDTEGGWREARAAHEQDGYDVVTFNLLQLHDVLTEFATLETKHFVVRMERREAAVYGREVLTLLEEAYRLMTLKYDVVLRTPIIVEIYPRPDDFAVRTFGMPGVSGYLGVCFGRVITMNSPASQTEHPANWESVLWHEFCHVITLEATSNRIPRWLSEGISVYEERQRDPRWGLSMNAQFRSMILEGKLTPLSQLSSAFIGPRSEFELQFGYFESMLAVEYLVQRFGHAALLQILRDLQRGVLINDALQRHAAALPLLEADFAEYAYWQASEFAPDVDWSRPDAKVLAASDPQVLASWVAAHPENRSARSLLADRLMALERWSDARSHLVELTRRYPHETGPHSAHARLARCCRALGDHQSECCALQQLIRVDAAAVNALERLLELWRQAEDWPQVLTCGEQLMAVSPLRPELHRARAEAARHLSKPDVEIAACEALLELDETATAGRNFRLAELKFARGDAAARRHVLAALEEAPRFRAAHRLLLRIVRAAD